MECSPFLPQSVRRLRWLKCFSASTRQSAPVSCVEPEERKKTQNLTRNGRRTGSPPARAGFWKDDQGDRWGSPAPDKGHDRLAARCAVDSHIHWRSHLSLATCLQLVAGSLSYHRHTDTGVAGAALGRDGRRTDSFSPRTVCVPVRASPRPCRASVL